MMYAYTLYHGKVDSLAKALYSLKWRAMILESTGEKYQDLFASVMEQTFENGDFIRTRPWGKTGDRKNDGYVVSTRTLYQCYAPNEIKAADTIAKMTEDYAGALAHWEEWVDNWTFAHNSMIGLGPEVVAKLLALGKGDGPSVGQFPPAELQKQLFSLNDDQIEAILGPVPSRVNATMIGIADIEPVLLHVERLNPTTGSDLRPVPQNKIEFNKLGEDARAALQLGSPRVGLVEEYMNRSRDPRLRDQLAAGLREKYLQLDEAGLDPDTVFARLHQDVVGDEPPPSRQAAGYAVLAFFFFECDIFKRPEDTK